MKKWLNYLVVISIAVLVTACGEKAQKYDYLPSDTKVVAFGDSVTFGYGVSPGESYPVILSELSYWNVINAGVNGDRTDQAKYRIDGVMSEHAPKLVIIELGGNDFLQRRSAKEVKEDLREIIKRVKDYGAIPVLVAVPSISAMGAITGKPSDSDIYQELANEEKINVIANVFSDILGQEDLKQDPIHPNSKGYRILAEGIYASLRDMGL